jgi:methylisocitrate lyase
MRDPHPTPGARFRAALKDRPLIIPGAFNALVARMAERAGFRAVYQSGAALSAGLAAAPDIGLLSQTEFAAQAGYLARAVSIPVISDADTGFGDERATARTVELFESAGLAGLHRKTRSGPNAADILRARRSSVAMK